MVTIYHASNKKIEKLEIRKLGFLKDFGYGFYTTKLLRQAERWVYQKYKGCGYINIFSYDEERVKEELKVKVFNLSDEWLDFVIKNRSYSYRSEYDIVEGPMADDQIYNYIDDFYDGIISREEFWRLVKFKYDTNQVCFLTQRSIKYLKFIGGKKYESI